MFWNIVWNVSFISLYSKKYIPNSLYKSSEVRKIEWLSENLFGEVCYNNILNRFIFKCEIKLELWCYWLLISRIHRLCVSSTRTYLYTTYRLLKPIYIQYTSSVSRTTEVPSAYTHQGKQPQMHNTFNI